MKPFLQKLEHIQRKNDSLLCLSLDTDVMKMPEFFLRYEDPQYEYNRRIIDATKDLVCAYTINVAYYESVGEHCWYTVHHTLARIPEEIITIGDGKRGETGYTGDKQAHSLCEDWEFTGTTVNPYMGKDAIEPFIKRKDQCAFVLTVTGNASSKDFQYLKIQGKPLYEHVVAQAKKWNTKKNIGLVVGAAKTKELKRIRIMAKELPILIPAIDAKKNDIETLVRYGCNKKGELAILNCTLKNLSASSEDELMEKASKSALSYRKQINKFRDRYFR